MKYIYEWVLVVSATLLFISADSLAAYWGKTNSKVAIVIMFILAPLGYLLFGLLNRTKTLAVSSGLVNMALLIGTVSIGLFFFKDILTLRQFIGLLLAVVAMALMV